MNARSPRRPFLTLLLLLPALVACASTAPAKLGRTGKVNHIGFVWLKRPGDAADRQALIDAAHLFAREIPEVQALTVGTALPAGSSFGDGSFDICLTMQFDDQAAMERYNQHPVHTKAAQEVFLPLASKLLFYDFRSE